MTNVLDLSPRDQTDLIFRSDKVNLMNEDLARAHCRELQVEASEYRRARRLVIARKLEQRAARAARRARRLAAAAIAAHAKAV